MKSSPVRKRYVLVLYGKTDLRRMEKKLSEKFSVRVKHADQKFAIFRTSQFDKDEFCSAIGRQFPEVSIITVSGTIRKCLKVAAMHDEELRDNQVQIPGS